jgi:hypothetical protein
MWIGLGSIELTTRVLHTILPLLYVLYTVQCFVLDCTLDVAAGVLRLGHRGYGNASS